MKGVIQVNMSEKFNSLIFITETTEKAVEIYNSIFEMADYKEAEKYAAREINYKKEKRCSEKYTDSSIKTDDGGKSQIRIDSLIDKIKKYADGMDTSLKHICCPSCKRFSKSYEWFNPIDGWDEIINKYGYCFLGELAVEIYEEYSDVLLSETREDEYNARYFWKGHPLERILFSATESLLSFDCTPVKRTMFDKRYGWEPIQCQIPTEEFEHDALSGLIMKCPHCGHIIETCSGLAGTLAPEGKQYCNLVRTHDWMTKNVFDVSYKIFSDEDKPFVSLSIFGVHLYPNVKGKIHAIETLKRTTFNTNTGMTYVFHEIDKKTKKAIPVNEEGKCATKICNITYSNKLYYNLVDKEVIQDVSDALCKKIGCERIDISQISKQNGFMVLARINRFAKMGAENINLLNCMESSHTISKKQLSEISKSLRDGEFMLKMIKRHKLKGKKRIQMCVKNPLLFYFEKSLKECGFNDNNVLLEIMGNSSMLVYFAGSYSRNIIANFVQEYSRLKNEAELYRKIYLSRTNISVLFNMASHFKKLEQCLELNDENKKLLLSGTLNEMSNKIKKLFRMSDRTDYMIPYSENEMKYNCMVGKFTFMLARSTHILEEAGEQFHNCVGGYESRVLNKTSTIVIMKDGEKFEACIEISPQGELIQVKDMCNQILKPYKFGAVKRFIKETGLTLRTSDLNIEEYGKTKEETVFEPLGNIINYYIVDEPETSNLMIASDTIEAFGGKYRFKYSGGGDSRLLVAE